MKAKEIITEIERIRAGEFTGGKRYLNYNLDGVKWKQLPGGSGLHYGIVEKEHGDISVLIMDLVPVPAGVNKVLIGRLDLDKYYGPIKNAYAVHTITVDEDRRGIGLAKALYGIVLTLLKATLVSGDSQTPGGRRNWLSLASIPGVEVKGLLSISDDDFGAKKVLGRGAEAHEKREYQAIQADAEKKIDMLMQLGFQYVGKQQNRWNGIEHYFSFDVTGGGGELAPAIKNQLSRVYDNYGTLLYARWTGQ